MIFEIHIRNTNIANNDSTTLYDLYVYTICEIFKFLLLCTLWKARTVVPVCTRAKCLLKLYCTCSYVIHKPKLIRVMLSIKLIILNVENQRD